MKAHEEQHVEQKNEHLWANRDHTNHQPRKYIDLQVV